MRQELRRVGLRRYKCFDGETSVEIAPLTILMGSNNSGKTALSKQFICFQAVWLSPMAKVKSHGY